MLCRKPWRAARRQPKTPELRLRPLWQDLFLSTLFELLLAGVWAFGLNSPVVDAPVPSSGATRGPEAQSVPPALRFWETPRRGCSRPNAHRLEHSPPGVLRWPLLRRLAC